MKRLVVALLWVLGCSGSGGDGAPASGGGAGASGAGGSGGGAGTMGVGTLVDFLDEPAYPDDFWQSSTFEESGMDGTMIESVVRRISISRMEVHSFLVAHRGRLVVERYGWNSGSNADHPGEPHQVLPDEPHWQASSTKSFLSALIGIALEDGVIPGLDQKAADWFPDYEDLNPSPEKDEITLEDLLTMRSGLESPEGDSSTVQAPDPARAMLSRPVVATVGETWNYANGNSDILAEILRVATSQTPLDYANERLFGPLGIPSPEWEAGQNGTQFGGFGLSLTSRQMARFGELYRNAGSFLGAEVVPAAWTDESTEPRCDTPWGGQYAYHFWVPNAAPGFFQTLGARGQVIFVNRELELVIVFTGDLPDETANSEYQTLIRSFIAPSVTQ
jgi:CubicO group peptidase (beta-lactamase class C family)